MIPFIDLAAQQKQIKPALDSAIAGVLAHGRYINGPEVAELEKGLCAFSGARNCIGVSNGTDALIAALQAYEIGPGDAIITSPFTFFATVEAIMILGATPVFADIDPVTFNLCPESLEQTIKQVRSENNWNLRAIMPVDLFGLCADYDAILPIANAHGLIVIQDSAQAFGAATPDGKRAPTHGHIGTTSFFPAKPLGCYGDGGAVFTDDDELAEKLRSIRVHGKGADKYDNVRVGQNCRLDTLQAAILIEKLKVYPCELELRQRVATRYTELIDKVNQQRGERHFIAPSIPPNHVSAWAQYTLRVSNRAEVMQRLKSAGIPTVIYYRTPLHLAKACASLGHSEGDFPHAEAASREVMSLPFHPYLDDEHIGLIVDQLQLDS
ncbi:MAG: DegT/DnrJ/EryC1/StrS family aminotransferase [Planctomycetota bacterium]